MIKTYEDWENSLDQDYVNQLTPDAWCLTCDAFEAGQQSQQAKIDKLQARIDEALKEIESGITGKHHIHYIAKILNGTTNEQ